MPTESSHNRPARPRRIFTTALAIITLAPLLAGCMADPEKARYLNNDRIIGNYTETQVGEAARTTAGVSAGIAAWLGLELLSGEPIEFDWCFD